MADVATDSVNTINPADMDDIRKIIQGLDQPQKRTIQAASHLSVKHALPKTCVGHTIIHENPCQTRLLNMELERIRHRSKEYSSVYEISRRTFMEKQARKQRKWKQQDDMRVSGMNFPNIRSSGIGGRSSVEVLYTSPRYTDDDNKTFMGKPLLPYMILRRERTEFIRRNNKIAVTKLPSVIESDSFKLRRYNSYCGEEFSRLQTKDTQSDGRFVALTDALSPLKSPLEDVSSAERRVVPDTPDDGTKYWFMDDEVSEGSIIPRGLLSRDSGRKVKVLFPSVSKENSRRPSVDREKTQYDIKLRKMSPDKPKAVGFPEFEGTKPSSSRTHTSARSIEGKVVDLKNPIVTELREDKPASSKAPTRKGILKSPKKTSNVTKETVEEKREKIKKDLQSKDLKELKDTYGQLKQVDSTGQKHPESNSDPRQGSAFHSPTMERRFAVKSEYRKQ